MSAWKLAFRLWLTSIFINAIILSFAILFEAGLLFIPALFILIIGGCVLTCPLILVVLMLVKVFLFLPNSLTAKITWLAFMLVLLVVLFYILLVLAMGGNIDIREPFFFLTGCASGLAVVLAVLFSKNSLITLHNQSYEYNLV